MSEACCLICGNPLPESRRFTCSAECYEQYKFHKEEFKRDIKKKPDTMLEFTTPAKKALWRKELAQYNQSTPNEKLRTCELCGKEFIAKTSRSYCCSPLCYDLNRRGLTQADL